MKKIKMTKRHFLKKNNLLDSYIFLSQYHKYNPELRGVIIQTLVEKYNSIFDRKDMGEEIKIKILSEIELELMCKVMELTESLASICYALTNDETKIKENMINFNLKGISAKTFYKDLRKSNRFFYTLFTYPEIKDLPISQKEKEFLKRIYFNNIGVVKELFKIVRTFRRFNTEAYNKNRHSRPMLVGLPTNDKTYYAFTTIASKKRQKIVNTAVLHGRPIFDRYIDLAKVIIQFQKDLLWNRIHYFECDGFKIPILASYFETSDYAKKIIENINHKCKQSTIRQNIKGELIIKPRLNFFKKRIDFYSKEFDKLNRKKDEELDKSVKEIDVS